MSIALKRGDSYPDEVPSIQVLSNGETIDKLQVAMLNKVRVLFDVNRSLFLVGRRA